MSKVPIRKSKTLGLLLKHWVGEVPEDALLPFHLQNFCDEVDRDFQMLESSLNTLVDRNHNLYVENHHLRIIVEGVVH